MWYFCVMMLSDLGEMEQKISFVWSLSQDLTWLTDGKAEIFGETLETVLRVDDCRQLNEEMLKFDCIKNGIFQSGLIFN